MKKAFVTVIGKDKPGIIARVSAFLAERNINIEDISQTVLQQNFTMIMLIDLSGAEKSFTALVEEAKAIGAEIGVDIFMQSEEIFNAMHKI